MYTARTNKNRTSSARDINYADVFFEADGSANSHHNPVTIKDVLVVVSDKTSSMQRLLYCVLHKQQHKT